MVMLRSGRVAREGKVREGGTEVDLGSGHTVIKRAGKGITQMELVETFRHFSDTASASMDHLFKVKLKLSSSPSEQSWWRRLRRKTPQVTDECNASVRLLEGCDVLYAFMLQLSKAIGRALTRSGRQ